MTRLLPPETEMVVACWAAGVHMTAAWQVASTSVRLHWLSLFHMTGHADSLHRLDMTVCPGVRRNLKIKLCFSEAETYDSPAHSLFVDTYSSVVQLYVYISTV